MRLVPARIAPPVAVVVVVLAALAVTSAAVEAVVDAKSVVSVVVVVVAAVDAAITIAADSGCESSFNPKGRLACFQASLFFRNFELTFQGVWNT
jgi:hypothetical protein